MSQASCTITNNKKRKGAPPASDSPATATTTAPATAVILSPLEADAKQYILASFEDPPKNCSRLWEKLSPAWKADRDISLAAANFEIVGLEDIGEEFTSDEGFLKELLTMNESLWKTIVPRFPNDVMLALSVAKGKSICADGNDFEALVEFCPAIKEEEEFWDVVLDECDPDFIFEYCPDRWLLSREFLLRFCTKWHHVLNCEPRRLPHPRVPRSLLEDEEFLRCLLKVCPQALQEVTRPAQLKIPDLMTQIISTQKGTGMIKRPGWIAKQFWKDDDFVRTFVQAGGLPFDYSKKWRSQRDLVLWVLETNPLQQYRYAVIQFFGPLNSICDGLLDDKEFMMQAIGICPHIFRYAGRRVVRDDEAFMLFLTLGTPEDVRAFLRGYSKRKFVLEARYEDWGRRLEMLRAFETTVEREILGTTVSIGCALGLLREGGSTVYTKSFREFLGLPVDEKGAGVLQQARHRLLGFETFMYSDSEWLPIEESD